ncbi:MAG: hypothetical protein FWD44_07485 [Oscillospiraceae bacterium]|nr:hypothetical protein [Oscillospiraceae bacterium]
MENKQTKSKQRVVNHGEVFTAECEVNAMLNLIKHETERIDSRFLEPACGNGNFLVEILRRKLAVVNSRYGKNADDYERYAVVAVSSIYGIDILQDNVEECQSRLFTIFDSEYSTRCRKIANNDTRDAVRFILGRNILCGNALTMKCNEDTSDEAPIVFSEWTSPDGYKIKRHEYIFAELLNDQTSSLFNSNDIHINDKGESVFIPHSTGEYPPVHYRRVHLNE